MPKKLSVEELNELRMKKRSGNKKEILFGKEIDALKKGEAIFISKEEWIETKVKTVIGAYYYGKYVKGVDEKDRVISYESVAGGFVITKLK